jgi:hypothetical protein
VVLATFGKAEEPLCAIIITCLVGLRRSLVRDSGAVCGRARMLWAQAHNERSKAMSRRIRSSFLLLGALAFGLLGPGVQWAQADPLSAWISINDLSEIMRASANGNGGYIPATNPATVMGFTPDAVWQLTNEGPGVFGVADIHLEYTTAANIVPGEVRVVNFNFYCPLEGTAVSDTLGITFTGHTLDELGRNVSVDLHFRSDTLDGIAPPPLVNGISVMETNDYVDVTALITGATGIGDFHTRVASDCIPEPASLTLLTMGAASFAGYGWRRWRRKA